MFAVTRRTIRRFTRPGLAAVLVIAQAMASFGSPVVIAKSMRVGACGSGSCGCETACGGIREDCCCSPTAPNPPPPPPPSLKEDCGKCGRPAGDCCCSKPEEEPEPAACPKCREREKKSSAATLLKEPEFRVHWIPAFQASKCRGDSPLGLMAEIPAIPPAIPSREVTPMPPAGLVALPDLRFSSATSPPLDPPPRCG